jgi:O-antigen ligase
MHHPGYLALFYTFAIVVVLHWLINKKHQNILKRTIAIILIFHFELFIVLLSSKAGMIGLGLVYLMNVFFIMLSDRTKVKRAIIYSAVLVVSLMVILSFFPASYGRFYSAKRSIEDNKVPDNLKTEGSVARLMVWKCSLEIIAENLPFGVGTGDVKTELNKKYHAKDLQQAIRENLNSHNQYLQTTIATGLPGLILLIACLVLPVIFGLGRKQYLLFIFSVLFAFHLLVESMLERQAGVVFFAFFYGLFFHFLSAGKVKPVSYSDP